jgi:DNA-directed RNA polymerase subunit RPC12/RpoP
MIQYYCTKCGKEALLNYPTVTNLLTDIQGGKKLPCKRCGEQIPATVVRSKFKIVKEFKDRDYNDKRDRYASPTQLYTSEEVATRFNFAMRLDGVTIGTSTVNSVICTRVCDPNFMKRSKGAHVSEVKGGRKDGTTVMGGIAARDIRRLVLAGDQKTHRDDEWLHLWGDNLGGPSEPSNFVSGSYAANPEMLVIEKALAQNSALTKQLILQIDADCSALHFGEYLTYKVINPKVFTHHFTHLIDLRNRVFTRADANTVENKIDVWLVQQAMKVGA